MKSQKSFITLLIIFGLWFGLVLGCSSLKNAEPATPIRITAEELYKTYNSNQADADRLYKDKMLIVTGTVGRADTRSREALVDARHTVLVYCLLFAPDQEGPISRLKEGQTVTVKGKCTGRARFLGMTAEQVSLRDCVIQ
jgi:hypothetical protein